VLLELPHGESGYSFEAEVLARAAWAGVPLREVAISVIYPPDRVSHFRMLYDNARFSWLHARLTVRAFLPWPHRTLTGNLATRTPESSRRADE
jgi:hypothetical protein